MRTYDDLDEPCLIDQILAEQEKNKSKEKMIPMSVIEGIRAEIEDLKKSGYRAVEVYDGLNMALEIIDKYAEQERDSCEQLRKARKEAKRWKRKYLELKGGAE